MLNDNCFKALQTHQSDLINELKLKAEQFEQFMKTSRSITNINENRNTQSKTESEIKIMEEITKRYAVEVKLVEKSYKDQIDKYEQVQTLLKHELQNIKIHLQVKTDEIESLKSTILKERVKAQEVIAAVEGSARDTLHHQTEVLKKCRLELKLYQQKMESLIQQVNERTDLVNQERESIMVLQKKIVDVKSTFHRREGDLLKSIDMIKKDSLDKVSHIKEKYHSAKKTAQHYKVVLKFYEFWIVLYLVSYRYTLKKKKSTCLRNIID